MSGGRLCFDQIQIDLPETRHLEALILFVFIVAVVLFAFRRKKEPASPKLSQSAIPVVVDEDEDAFEPRWQTIAFKCGKETRPENMVALKGGSDVRVAGFAKRGGLAYAKSIKPGVTTLELRREPENAVDGNAIALFGSSKFGDHVRLGYLPADLAGDIAAEFSPEMPIEPELRKVGWKSNGAVFMAINVLVPNASGRKKYRLE